MPTKLSSIVCDVEGEKRENSRAGRGGRRWRRGGWTHVRLPPELAAGVQVTPPCLRSRQYGFADCPFGLWYFVPVEYRYPGVPECNNYFHKHRRLLQAICYNKSGHRAYNISSRSFAFNPEQPPSVVQRREPRTRTWPSDSLLGAFVLGGGRGGSRC